MKVAELEGALLDLWVARAGEVWSWAHEVFPTMTLDPTFRGAELFTFEGGRTVCRLVPSNPFRQDYQIFAPSRLWEHGGPIIEREQVIYRHFTGGIYEACVMRGEIGVNRSRVGVQKGATLLQAAMRAFVASKFGEEVSDEVTP